MDAPFLDAAEAHSAIAPTARGAVLDAMAGAKLGGTQLVVFVNWPWSYLTSYPQVMCYIAIENGYIYVI
jgi:hypothetical protein